MGCLCGVSLLPKALLALMRHDVVSGGVLVALLCVGVVVAGAIVGRLNGLPPCQRRPIVRAANVNAKLAQSILIALGADLRLEKLLLKDRCCISGRLSFAALRGA